MEGERIRIMSDFYNGNKILTLKDINRKVPGVFIVEGTRTGGKTTFFNSFCVNRFLERGEQFLLLYRNKLELTNVDEKFFSDIKNLFFDDMEMKEKKINGGAAVRLLLDGKECGFATALSQSKKIKTMSHIFNGVVNIIFDEFQPEDNMYLTDEVTRLRSILISVARGRGEMSRYVRLFMISNLCSIVNPYFTRFNITNRLRKDTHFLRFDGGVYERTVNAEAIKAAEENPVLRAFEGDSYDKMLMGNAYLLDEYTLTHTPHSMGNYICTVYYNSKYYGVIEYPYEGVVYINNNGDRSRKPIMVLRSHDMKNNFNTLRPYTNTVLKFSLAFSQGMLRFKNLECREMAFEMIQQLSLMRGYYI